MTKTNMLNKELGEILSDYGFMKIPTYQGFIRLCGDGVFQGAFIDWSPSSCFSIEIWLDSVFQDPEKMFTCHLNNRHSSPLIFAESLSRYFRFVLRPHGLDTIKLLSLNIEAQFRLFIKYIIPIFVECDNHKKLVELKGKLASGLSNPYDAYRMFNLFLFLKDYESAKKYIFESGFYIERHINKEKAMNLLNNIDSIKPYLEECKRQNLEDFSTMMKGKADDIIAKYT